MPLEFDILVCKASDSKYKEKNGTFNFLIFDKRNCFKNGFKVFGLIRLIDKELLIPILAFFMTVYAI